MMDIKERIKKLRRERSKAIQKRIVEKPRLAWKTNMAMPSDFVAKKTDEQKRYRRL